MYADMQAQQQGGAQAAGAQQAGAQQGAGAGQEDVVDAEFKEVKDAK
jgi:molecular chaperone DnaK